MIAWLFASFIPITTQHMDRGTNLLRNSDKLIKIIEGMTLHMLHTRKTHGSNRFIWFTRLYFRGLKRKYRLEENHRFSQNIPISHKVNILASQAMCYRNGSRTQLSLQFLQSLSVSHALSLSFLSPRWYILICKCKPQYIFHAQDGNYLLCCHLPL